MSQYNNKVVIVTGAASGMGRSMAKQLAEAGANLTIADLDEGGLEAVKKEIELIGAPVVAEVLNVADKEAVCNMVKNTANKNNRLDYIFNNAGICITGNHEDVNLEHWDRIIDINIKGVVYGTDTAYEIMRKQGYGHIVNMASMAGIIAVPGQVAYSTTKHAVLGLCKGLREEAKFHGVKVSAICPGVIHTEILQNMKSPNIEKDEMLSLLPTKYLINADQAATIILKGVIKNKAQIILPTSSSVIAWLYRLFPALFNFPYARAVDQLNKLRRAS